MKRATTLGVAVLAGLLGVTLLSKARRERLGSALSRRMLVHMRQMMEKLPPDSPPKLVMSVLPRLRDQNEQIIEMLRQQNAMLREQLQRH